MYMNKAMKKFSNVFGKNLAKAFLFTVKNNKNVQCDFNVEFKINNMNFKMDRLFFDINENQTLNQKAFSLIVEKMNELNLAHEGKY